MSNIRLKAITVEPSLSPLIIQNGNIVITNTNVSDNMISGALIISGGLAINCTSDSISSTSGGGLTLGGGLAVTRKSNFGNNITLDNSSSLLQINGISTNRLFLDSIANKNFYISPDGVDKRFDLYDTTLKINITTSSTNSSSGALVINGGISINSAIDSTNVTSGGALTVKGGASFYENVNINKSLTLNSSGNSGLIIGYGGSQITLNGTTLNSTISMIDNNLIINNNSNINLLGNSININTLSVSNTSSSFSKFIQITDTIESVNSSTGTLVVDGGISIICTSDSSSFTSGGALTLNGGMAIRKKVYTGDSIGIEMSNINKNNKIVMYQQDQDITNTFLFTGFGVNALGSMRFQVPSVNSDYIFYSATNSNEVFRIKGTNEVQFIGSNQKYSILGGGFNSDSLSFQSNSLATDFSLNLFTQDGDTNDNNDIKIFGLGLPNNITNSEYLLLGWDKNNLQYNISSNKTGSGVSRDISFNSNQFLLSSDQSVYFKTTKYSINSSTGGLVINGGISIGSTEFASSLTQGGALTVSGGASFGGNMYIRSTFNINATSGSQIQMSSQDSSGSLLIQTPNANVIISGITDGSTYTSNLSLYSLNSSQFLDYELFNINCSSTDASGYYSIYSLFGGTGINRAIQLGVDTFTHITLNTNGNVGINTTDANFTLDVLGSFNATNYSYITGLMVNDTQPALNSTTAALVVTGGVGIKKELITLGLNKFQNVTASSNSSTGSFVMSGGLSINNSVNATNATSGGAMTVRGGAAIGGDLYIGGSIYYTNTASISNTYAYLTLTATDQSISVGNGSLITFGGISIQSDLNATSTTSGGGLTVVGGIATQNDLYVGGNINAIGGVMNFYSVSSGNLIQLYDINGVKRTSLDLNSSNNNFHISRYNNSGIFVDKPLEIINNSGIIKFNNTAISTAVGIGALVSEGGITIDCSVNSTSLGNGGAFSVFGGASISKNLYIGGNTYFSNTTVSNDVSSGSVLVAGGVGISGNLNVLGNTVISGNLTIIGTTTSVQSTNTLLTDNIIVLNSGPSGTKDSGFLIQRYQSDNDTSIGDVVNDTAYFTDSLPLQTGMTSIQLKLSAAASSADDYYNNWYIKITSGFSVSQVRKITSYVGSTRIATLSSAFTTQNPTLGDSVSLYNKPYLGIFYSEINDRFEFGSTVQDPGQTNIALTDYIPVIFRSATSTSTQESTNSTTGCILLTGGLAINNTTDAVSITSGGGATIAGGLAVRKTLYVGNTAYINGVDITPNVYDTPSTKTFTAANVLIPTDVTGLAFDSTVWGADIYISTRITANTNYYSNIHIRCVNKNGTWDSVSEYVGDNVVAFDITNSGQVQYITSSTFPSFTNCIFKYKVVTN
jgi:hypothetical protein